MSTYGALLVQRYFHLEEQTNECIVIAFDSVEDQRLVRSLLAIVGLVLNEIELDHRRLESANVTAFDEANAVDVSIGLVRRLRRVNVRRQ